jgi:hypothetical protein
MWTVPIVQWRSLWHQKTSHWQALTSLWLGWSGTKPCSLVVIALWRVRRPRLGTFFVSRGRFFRGDAKAIILRSGSVARLDRSVAEHSKNQEFLSVLFLMVVFAASFWFARMARRLEAA